ncbi:MAG: ATP-binding cassette domain-containing protein [Chloroflexi bacterium]|nr:ATP-binding cassette domain-containing protein [Chloroflexota bacterium]
MAAIEVDSLTKVFRVTRREPGLLGAVRALVKPSQERKVGLDGLSFAVEPGELVGYIGINGAGKSTTIKVLTGVLVPSGGRVRVLGRDPHRQRIANARDIGVVFGQRSQLQWDLPLVESLHLVGRLYETEPARFRQLLGELTDTLDLGELLHVPIRQMSLGQKMRAELAATLVHEPAILYLDEPTIGLDLMVKERIRQVIREHNRRSGTTVLLTTHDLGDIEELAQRVMIIDRGRLIYDGPLAAIRERFGRYRTLTLVTADHICDGVTLPPEVEELECGERKLVLRFDRSRISASRVTAALMAQIEVCDFSLAEPTLASVVREIYGGALGEGVPA